MAQRWRRGGDVHVRGCNVQEEAGRAAQAQWATDLPAKEAAHAIGESSAILLTLSLHRY